MIARLLATLFVTLLAAACAARGASPSGDSGVVDVQLLALNDFHGSLEPPAGSNGRIGAVVAGGSEFLIAHLRALTADNPNTITVAAGDNIGATPILSSLFHDEPTIETLSAAGLRYSAVGNHELDEGWAELYRMQNGGCHPVDGCQDGTPFDGARFRFLSANIRLDPAKVDAAALARSGWKPTGSGPQTLFPATAVESIGGVRIGFIGLTLQGAPSIVGADGIVGLTFLPEATAANDAARALRRQGVNAIVVVMHEGGFPATEDPNACEGMTGPLTDIVRGMSDDIDVVVSGHTHRAYVCTMGTKLVTSAASLSRLITDIDLTIDRRTGRVTSKRARNVLVTRDVARAADATAVIERYRPMAAKVADRTVGTATGIIAQTTNEAGESPLGDLVADAMLEAARAAGHRADVAMTNRGGIRADLVPTASVAGQPGNVTYGNLFELLPFGNVIVVRTLTGDQLVEMLEQQFLQGNRVLQVSDGFSYTWDSTRPVGQRIDRDSIRIGGQPLVASQPYRVVSNDFVWAGGDDFTAARAGTDPVAVGTDVDLLTAYLSRHSPVRAGAQNRITRAR